MRRYILILLIIPSILFSFAFISLHKSEYFLLTSLPAKVKAKHNTDPLRLRKEDLFDKQDKSWTPEFDVDPNDFYEEYEIPKRSEILGEEKAS